jgi:pimeloyl-ACP methyl ester carboxylesterase
MTHSAIILLLGVVGLMALAAWLYTPDKSRIQLEAQYATPPSTFVQAAGLRLHVRETGPVDGLAVVMLHGFGSSLFTWEPWAKALSEHFRVIRFDLPGFGLTGPDPSGNYSDTRGLQVLAGLMAELSVQEATLIGNSMGGKIAWMFAAEHPERVSRLILVAPDGFSSREFRYGRRTKVPLLVRLLPYTLPTFMVRMTLAPAFGNRSALTNAILNRYRDMMLLPGNRKAMIARMEQIELEPPEAMLARITAPTLLLWGDKDLVIPVGNAIDFETSIHDCQLVTFPNLGHLPQEEAPLQSLAPVRAFLDQ